MTTVHTCAVATARGKCETRFAHTFKAAIFIDAHAIQAHVCYGTFIMVCREKVIKTAAGCSKFLSR